MFFWGHGVERLTRNFTTDNGLCAKRTSGLDCAVFYVPSRLQHSIGYMGDGFLQVKRPNQQYQSTEGDATKENKNNSKNIIHREIRNSTC